MNAWHANDCGAGCAGCGWINGEGVWVAGPCPPREVEWQLSRSEDGVNA
jgi:hypothetical protein